MNWSGTADDLFSEPVSLTIPAVRAHCQLCGCSPLRRFEVPGQTTLWQCDDCGLYQNGPILSTAEYDDDYQTEYIRHQMRKVKTAKLRLRLIRSLLDQNSVRLLDIGCSVGCTLLAAESENWSAVGIDVSEAAVRSCKERGLDSVVVDGCSLPFDSGSFDVITAWHVIEHMRDVRATLAEWSRVLRPGGILAIETPDASYIKARIFGSSYRKFWPPHHTYTFTRSTLEPFLEQAGLDATVPPLQGRLKSWLSLGGYGAARGAYESLRRLGGLRKNLQMFARKTRASGIVRLPARSAA